MTSNNKETMIQVNKGTLIQVIGMLNGIIGSLDLTEEYEDAYWYIYRSPEDYLENDLLEIVNILNNIL